ncbi:MAG: 2'-5' RNA ligase family protein [Propionibacteriaceae bacterium]|nr:2'-5' RNA ligase family protein [Propionibacteriaceae bacterium]
MLTIACDDRDFTEWHGGARHILIWAALVDTDEVRAAVESAREHWAGVLLPRYERQPHITVRYGGPVPREGAVPMDPLYTDERVAADRATIEALRLSPFDVRIGGWSTFEMVPYLHAEAPELGLTAGALGEDLLRPYVPHVTIGHYAVEAPLAEMSALGAGWSWPEAVVRIERLSLLRYDAADIAGPLTVVDEVPLTPGV